jgi:hypothetical protein
VVGLLTFVALLENTILPWAPFYVVYATLATWIPFRLGGIGFGSMRDWRWGTWVAVGLLPLAVQAFGGIWVAALFPALLGALGVDAAAADGITFSLPAALGELFRRTGEIWSVQRGTAQGFYLGGILLRAGLGEEVCYRGYLQEALRRRHGFGVSLVVASLLFAVRHATQLGLVTPYPWGAAAAWVAFSFLAGLLLGWMYEKTGGLAAPVLAHYLINLIPFLLRMTVP